MKLNIDMVINLNDYNSDLQRLNKELLFVNIKMQLFCFQTLPSEKVSSNDVSINISLRVKWPEQYIYTEDCSSNNQLCVSLQICLLHKHSLQHKDHLNLL